jgi:hypothetical protein
MRRFILFVVVIGILIALIAIAIEYHNFRFYNSSEYIKFRGELFLTLSRIDNDSIFWRSASIDDLLNEIKETAEYTKIEELNVFYRQVSDIKNQLRIKYLSDSNTVIIYNIGFDGIDNKLNSKIFYYDSLSFIEYLLKPKGDILINGITFPDQCLNAKVMMEYFKNGQQISDTLVFPVFVEAIKPSINRYIENTFPQEKKIHILLNLSKNKLGQWQGKVNCNWSNSSDSVNHQILEKFENEIAVSQLDALADSIIQFIYYESK